MDANAAKALARSRIESEPSYIQAIHEIKTAARAGLFFSVIPFDRSVHDALVAAGYTVTVRHGTPAQDHDTDSTMRVTWLNS